MVEDANACTEDIASGPEVDLTGELMAESALKSIAGTRPEQGQAREPDVKRGEEALYPVATLPICETQADRRQFPRRVDEDVALALGHRLAAVVAARSPFSVVLTDWLSTNPSLGVGSRPS